MQLTKNSQQRATGLGWRGHARARVLTPRGPSKCVECTVPGPISARKKKRLIVWSEIGVSRYRRVISSNDGAAYVYSSRYDYRDLIATEKRARISGGIVADTVARRFSKPRRNIFPSPRDERMRFVRDRSCLPSVVAGTFGITEHCSVKSHDVGTRLNKRH